MSTSINIVESSVKHHNQININIWMGRDLKKIIPTNTASILPRHLLL